MTVDSDDSDRRPVVFHFYT